MPYDTHKALYVFLICCQSIFLVHIFLAFLPGGLALQGHAVDGRIVNKIKFSVGVPIFLPKNWVVVIKPPVRYIQFWDIALVVDSIVKLICDLSNELVCTCSDFRLLALSHYYVTPFCCL